MRISLEIPLNPGEEVYYYNQGDGEPALSFYDRALTIRAPDALVADAHGKIADVFLAPSAPFVFARIPSRDTAGTICIATLAPSVLGKQEGEG